MTTADTAILRTAKLLMNGQTHELRALGANGTRSGIYSTPRMLAEAAGELDGKFDIYVTLNPVVLSPVSIRKVGRDEAIHDTDIARIEWFGVDIDDDPHQKVALEISRFLRNAGWPDAVMGSSGTGSWLLYRVAHENTRDKAELRRRVLMTLKGMWSENIDTSVYNASRIVRLFGTVNLKNGERSSLVVVPKKLAIVSDTKLQAVAELQDAHEDADESADLEAITNALAKLDIEVGDPKPGLACTLLPLSDCPFLPDDTHATAAFLMQFPDGGINFRCLGGRCQAANRNIRHLCELLGIEIEYPDEEEAEVLEQEMPPLRAAVPKRGYLTDIVNFFAEATDVPAEYALSVGIAQLSAIMTGRMAVDAWEDVIRPHLWIAFVSPPATRKTHAWKIGLRILTKAVREDLAIPSQTTVPALIKFLAEERRGAANGFMFHSELKQFLESCQQSWQAGTQDFMSELFDSNEIVGELRITRQGNVIHHPSVSIMGALTDAGFQKYARTSAIMDGYLTRFVFMFRESAPIQNRGLRAARIGGSRMADVAKSLRSRYKLIASLSGDNDDRPWPYIIPVSDNAVRIFDTYCDRIKSEHVDRGVEGFRDRVPVQVLKIAMCYTASRAKDKDDFVIRGEDVKHAINFMEYQRTRAWDIIAVAAETQSRTAEYRLDLRVHIQELQKKQAEENGTKWTKEKVSKRDLQRSMTNMSAKALDGYLETLQVAGEIQIWKERAKKTTYRGGRPSVSVRLTSRGWVRERWKIR